jgi:hypothetical protein
MSGNERVLPGDRDLARDASGGHYRPKEAATARTIPDVGGSPRDRRASSDHCLLSANETSGLHKILHCASGPETG